MLYMDQRLHYAWLQAMALHPDRYHFATWLHPVLLSLRLSNTWYNPHPLQALCSFALAAPTRTQVRGMLFFLSRHFAALLQLALTRMYERRRTLRLQSLSTVPTGSCLQRTWFPHMSTTRLSWHDQSACDTLGVNLCHIRYEM
jgi:hypothetical protein